VHGHVHVPRKLQHNLALPSQAESDDGIGCIVITGAGERAFSAGGDIKEQLSDDARHSDEEMDAKRDNKRRYEIAASLKDAFSEFIERKGLKG